MRVLYVGKLDPYETGGTRRFCEIVKRVSRYGIRPYVLDLRKAPDDLLTHIGALRSLKEVVVLSKSGVGYKELISRVDLIVAASESPSTVFISYRIARRYGKPLTVVIQSPVKLKYTPASTEPILIDPLWLPQEVQVLNILKKITVLTVSYACVIESSIKIPNYIVIRPGVGIDYERFQRVEVFEKKYDAIFMARLTPEKGIFDLIKIWSYVVKEMPKAKLAIAGKFKNNQLAYKFFDYIYRYNLRKNIIYLGFLSGLRKVQELKSANIFVYPSLLDAFPIAALEALASGLPVVAYDIPAIRYNYPKSIVARVPVRDIRKFAERIIELLQCQDLDKVSNMCKIFASKFTWDNVAKSEVEAYTKVLESSQ